MIWWDPPNKQFFIMTGIIKIIVEDSIIPMKAPMLQKFLLLPMFQAQSNLTYQQIRNNREVTTIHPGDHHFNPFKINSKCSSLMETINKSHRSKKLLRLKRTSQLALKVMWVNCKFKSRKLKFTETQKFSERWTHL